MSPKRGVPAVPPGPGPFPAGGLVLAAEVGPAKPASAQVRGPGRACLGLGSAPPSSPVVVAAAGPRGRQRGPPGGGEAAAATRNCGGVGSRARWRCRRGSHAAAQGRGEDRHPDGGSHPAAHRAPSGTAGTPKPLPAPLAAAHGRSLACRPSRSPLCSRTSAMREYRTHCPPPDCDSLWPGHCWPGGDQH